ncbi:hypothetical protein [Rhodoplanes elegans]|uniref:hypothetical protein n=1 Tax=Rhodoplanes elegans TaxID=29408 RepID=UPI0011B936F2|nr:hypothetical protein [Rhodoplanes elegans]
MVRLYITASAIVISLVVAAGAQEGQRLSCTGAMIEPTALAKTPQTIQVTVKSGNVSVDAGGKTTDARVVSNNTIQLKFEAGDLVGEYFHYTGQLFIIYPSGHLAQMTCSKK